MSKTYGDMMREALAISTQEEADEWFLKEVNAMKEGNKEWDMEKCADTVRNNLGYMAGYFDQETSKHVHKFFGANHPIFGGPGYWTKVTSKKAFNMGKKAGEDI